VAGPAARVGRVDPEWGPELDVGRGEAEVRGHDADDRRGRAVQDERATDHAGVAAVATLPERVADDRHVLGARTVVLLTEDAPELRLHAERGKELPGRARELDALGLAVAGDRASTRPVRGQMPERPVLVPIVEVLGARRRDSIRFIVGNWSYTTASCPCSG
jgi:hypothetical protein